MIKLLITDLDDTLYSWTGFFIPAFYEMVNKLSQILGIPESDLLQEYKLIHQEKGSVEYPYTTFSLPSVKKTFPNCTEAQLNDILDSAFHCFNSSRKKNLHLFPHVEQTLEKLFNLGIIIVGYTESAEENGVYRLKRLGIDKFFSKVYVSYSQFQRKSSNLSFPKTQVVREKKPNAEVLKQICIDEKIDTKEAIYIGDSLIKDVYMSKAAGITSVLCKYPKNKEDDNLYLKLLAISHWTESDFAHETKLKENCEKENIFPDFTITSFREVVPIIDNLNGIRGEEQ